MIPLYVKNGVAYVWNAEDWLTLRTKTRMSGALIGTVPSFPRQNDFQGLPLALTSVESALLVEIGICELHIAKNLNDSPGEEEKRNIEISEQKILEEQNEAFRKKKTEQLSQKIDIILAGKKQKLLQKGLSDVHLDKETLLQEEINKFPSLTVSQALVHLPTEHSRELVTETVSIDCLQPSVMDREGSIRYNIFKDLWLKGHYITSGSKFGCDYLLYPGDPVRFHATYMVRCVYDTLAPFRPTNLVAFGRLSVAVNKLAILAFCNSFGKIEYQTLQWHDNIN
ncbi:tRNA-splicing endonuclease subunit Sen34 [Papilio machaon]|uniref:tRNA-splicing endonuclease subunit Sen34 n=1 Tax=Papilio machaon TaxID=76193 RepID=A0A194QNP7_PAPMA|nr:tRNA-splicing endonuclease subunit Sen34 [Papilio machaon]